MLSPKAKQILIDNYRQRLLQYKKGPGVAHYKSVESQFMRLEKLTEIGDLRECKILEIGCGIGDFYGLLKKKFKNISYTGIDIVPEMIAVAREKFPQAKFECRDIFEQPLTKDYDYVLISGVFNNAIPKATQVLKSLTKVCFDRARRALGFNFISTYVNYTEEDMAYHDPLIVLKHCLTSLSPKVTMFHHYKRADVCVFVYK